jgi:hypothetical protein
MNRTDTRQWAKEELAQAVVDCVREVCDRLDTDADDSAAIKIQARRVLKFLGLDKENVLP